MIFFSNCFLDKQVIHCVQETFKFLCFTVCVRSCWVSVSFPWLKFSYSLKQHVKLNFSVQWIHEVKIERSGRERCGGKNRETSTITCAHIEFQTNNEVNKNYICNEKMRTYSATWIWNQSELRSINTTSLSRSFLHKFMSSNLILLEESNSGLSVVTLHVSVSLSMRTKFFRHFDYLILCDKIYRQNMP